MCLCRSHSGQWRGPAGCLALKSCTMASTSWVISPIVLGTKLRGKTDKWLAKVIQLGRWLHQESNPSLHDSREGESESWAHGYLSSASICFLWPGQLGVWTLLHLSEHTLRECWFMIYTERFFMVLYSRTLEREFHRVIEGLVSPLSFNGNISIIPNGSAHVA